MWQLELPSADARLELGQAGGPELPDELAALLAAHLRSGGVEPIAELRTRRRGELVRRNGATAEVTIDEVAVMDARRAASELVEVEIELLEGDPDGLEQIAKSVARAGATRANGAPKVFRALGLERAREPEDGPFETLRARLRTQLGEILAHDPGTRLGRDPESLHAMRVAVRRSRALLRAGAPLVATDTRELAAELTWLGGVLGEARDLDVLRARLRAEVDGLDPLDRRAARSLLQTLERQRTRIRPALLKTLDGPRYLALLDRFDATLAELQATSTNTSLRSLAQRELRKAREAARALGDDAPDEALHDLRKRGKRARYAAELAGRTRVAKRAKALQDVLGEHQDAVVAEARLRALAASAKPHARDSWRTAWRRLESAFA